MKKAVPIIVLIVIVVAAGAYLIARNRSQNAAAPMPSMSMAATAAGAAQATDKVTIDNFAFSPAAITVKKGSTVTWNNQDSATHTVTETDGQTGPASQDLNTGQSYSFTYNTAGTFHYHCSIHSSMTGTVTVTE